MPADVVIERELTREESRRWLERLRIEKREQ
jgi:hypothetical protein